MSRGKDTPGRDNEGSQVKRRTKDLGKRFKKDCPPFFRKTDPSLCSSPEEGGDLARDIGAVAYMECSAKTGRRVDKIFKCLGRPEFRNSTCISRALYKV